MLADITLDTITCKSVCRCPKRELRLGILNCIIIKKWSCNKLWWYTDWM